jgi:uncharacterized protein YwlG (UPF0340 family)
MARCVCFIFTLGIKHSEQEGSQIGQNGTYDIYVHGNIFIVVSSNS